MGLDRERDFIGLDGYMQNKNMKRDKQQERMLAHSQMQEIVVI